MQVSCYLQTDKEGADQSKSEELSILKVQSPLLQVCPSNAVTSAISVVTPVSLQCFWLADNCWQVQHEAG